MVIALIIVGAIAIVTLAMYMRASRALGNQRVANVESISRLQSERSILQERLRLAENRIEEMKRDAAAAEVRKAEQAKRDEDRFRVVANDILTGQVATMRTRSEKRLNEILDPLKKELDAFGRAVAECYANESRERFSLQKQLEELIKSNHVVGSEARQLTTALRGDTRRQGQWGEMVLENILSMSGLAKGREFETQMDVATDEGTAHQRPDVVVRYPDGKCVIIDAKTSLTAFMEYVDAVDDNQRRLWGEKHVESVRRHIKELADKRYQDSVKIATTDFVMMFIPNEAAYMTAMQLDDTLWQHAYENRVLIVSPTHLISALKVVKQMWLHDKQTKNAIKIAEAAGSMYDKFSGFVDNMMKLRRSLNQALKEHDEAMGKLSMGRGNLVAKAEELRSMGVKVKKTLGIESTDFTSDYNQTADSADSGERSKSGF